MGRIGMSQGELRRVGVLARVKSKELNVGGCSEPGASKLPAGEAVVEAVSRGRGQRVGASQCGTSQCASQAGEISAAGDEAGA